MNYAHTYISIYPKNLIIIKCVLETLPSCHGCNFQYPNAYVSVHLFVSLWSIAVENLAFLAGFL